MKLWRDVGEAMREAHELDRDRDSDRWYWQRASMQVRAVARHLATDRF